MDRVRKHAPYIRRLFKEPAKKRRLLINRASKGEICSVCEIVKNVVHNPALNLKLVERKKQALRSHRKAIQNLISRRVPTERKRKILQSGKGGPLALIPLIASVAGPIISSLLNRSR